MFFFFFFNDTATTEIYTLSLHDALPICHGSIRWNRGAVPQQSTEGKRHANRCSEGQGEIGRAPSELQSPDHLVCRLLLEKKKKKKDRRVYTKIEREQATCKSRQ